MTRMCPPTRSRQRTPPRIDITDAGLGAVIRTERQRQRLHQDVLADAAGIDAKVFSRIERGERPLRVSELAAISSALNTASEDLLIRARHQHRFSARSAKD